MFKLVRAHEFKCSSSSDPWEAQPVLRGWPGEAQSLHPSYTDSLSSVPVSCKHGHHRQAWVQVGMAEEGPGPSQHQPQGVSVSSNGVHTLLPGLAELGLAKPPRAVGLCSQLCGTMGAIHVPPVPGPACPDCLPATQGAGLGSQQRKHST